MTTKTKIQWTDHSSNPIQFYNTETGERGWFCVKASPGCAHCYSERMNLNPGLIPLGNHLTYNKANLAKMRFEVNRTEIASWARMKQPKKIFVCDMTDLFGEWLDFPTIAVIFDGMRAAPQHIFQVLTKRAERMCEFFDSYYTDEVNNAWLGVSAENQEQADQRIPWLLNTPAKVRFVSCEPLLGLVEMEKWSGTFSRNWLAPKQTWQPGYGPINWIIAGCESGPNARPADLAWFPILARSMPVCRRTVLPETNDDRRQAGQDAHARRARLESVPGKAVKTQKTMP